jgi:glutathione S-transferase
MKLYTYDPAPNPQRVNMFMQQKGIQIESEQIDMMTAQQLTDDYKRVNPLATLPALQLNDGELLTEVIGICCYLEVLYPDKPMMGTTALEKAQVISWDHRVFVEGLSSIADALRNRSKGFAGRAMPGPMNIEQIEALVPRGLQRVNGFFTVLNEHLAGRQFMVGDSLTLADIDVLIYVDFAKWIKQGVPEECKDLQAYYHRISELLN